MGYVICEKCGGYYKLEKGESHEDFEACNCGGTLKHIVFGAPENQKFSSDLRYVKSIQKESKKPKNALKCNICGHEQEKGLICSKCGSRIRRKTNYQTEFKTNHRSRYYYGHVAKSSSIHFFDRIHWGAVTSGIIFYIVASIVTKIVGGIFLGGDILAAQNANTTAIFSIISIITLIFGLISAFIPLASGFWAVSYITTRNYVTGIMTGGMVGVVIAIISVILYMTFGLLFSGFYGQINIGVGIIAGLMVLIIGIIYGGAMTAAGGLIAVYVRRHTSYIR
ncbi:hypothetical protein [Methanobacterium sp.]|uniref:hypothetical protein n=1 Tax=Methanobacterium sp. TaxID=2164 RepID=UPI003C763EC0